MREMRTESSLLPRSSHSWPSQRMAAPADESLGDAISGRRRDPLPIARKQPSSIPVTFEPQGTQIEGKLELGFL